MVRRDGRVVILDFGLAKDLHDGGSLQSIDQHVLGTPEYMSPEQARGEEAGPPSDLYALGVTGWTMLAGHTPFMADDTPALLLKHLTEPVPPLLRAAPGTSQRDGYLNRFLGRLAGQSRRGSACVLEIGREVARDILAAPAAMPGYWSTSAHRRHA